jgi:hypothetical protein
VWVVNNIVNLELRKEIHNFMSPCPSLSKKIMLQLVWNNISIRGSEARPLGVRVEEGEQGEEEIEREPRAVRVCIRKNVIW